jgi:hypothetical protein
MTQTPIATFTSLALPALLACAGCSVTSARGYEALAEQPAETIEATPGRMFGVAPWSYDLPDGRQVVIDTSRGQQTWGPITAADDVYFEASLGDARLVCASEPRGPGVPETRFGCWSPGDREVTFWMAPGAKCGVRNLDGFATLTDPTCWDGTLTTPSARYEVAYSWMEAPSSPVAWISWTDAARGEAVQAVNSVVDLRLEVRARPGARGEDADLLALHAVALHYWYHRVYSS